MARKLSNKLLRKLASHPNVHAKLPAIRNAISSLRRENPGVTINAAAYLYAKSKGFSVFQQLDEEDRNGLQHVKTGASGSRDVVSRPKRVRARLAAASFGIDFIHDANANAGVYPYLFILENSLRETILTKFREENNWWNNTAYVSKDVQDYASQIESAERKYPWVQKRGKHPIYYVGLNELYRIITKNWTRFENVFRDQGNLRTWFNELVPVRNLVAHNVRTASDERKNVEIRTKFICTLIENSKKQH